MNRLRDGWFVRQTHICLVVVLICIGGLPMASRAQTMAWEGWAQGGFGASAECGGRLGTSGFYGTPQQAAAAVCRQLACDASRVEQFAISADGKSASFTCDANAHPGAPLWQAVWGFKSVYLKSVHTKAAGECPPIAAGGAPCQGQQGNPIRLSTGNKFHVERDYSAAGPHPLQFAHYYNSTPRAIGGSAMGQRRRHTYERAIAMLPGAVGPVATAVRHDGSAVSFTFDGAAWKGDSDVPARLVRLDDGAGNTTGWRYMDASDEVESYDAAGRLLSIENRAGLRHTLVYDDQARVASVFDSFGRTLQFTYDTRARVASIVAGGATYSYSYDLAGNLSAVTYPDGSRKAYHYEVAGQPLLTGITDETNVRYSTYGYEAGIYDPRAVRTELHGGVNRIDVSWSGGFAQVKDARGTVRLFSQITAGGILKNSGVDLPCPTCDARAYTYDTNGFVASKTDFNGNRTNYTRDARGLETKRVDGLTSTGGTTPVTRTATSEWHAHYRLPTRIAEPLRLTTFTYGEPTDSNPGNRGSLLSKTVQATTDANGSLGFGAALTGAPRTWTYTYNANGQVLTIDGPRTDVSDLTTYTYYANDAACTGVSAVGCRGQVATITNALGHVTTIDAYNAHGQPLTITDPNGLVTTLPYDARMRLTSRNVGGEITGYAYDAAGQLTQVALPDGSGLAYTYDGAHRLTRIDDREGNRIVYTLDLMGNRIKEDVVDPSGTLAQTRTRVYDVLDRLVQDIGAAGQTRTYARDSQGNVTSIDGPLAGPVDLTKNTFDALNRLVRVTDPNAGSVSYGYNGRDQLVSVADPRAITTTYSYDGLDNLNQLVSPDAGGSANTYDAAGNLVTATDAKGQQTRYTYDALNRVTKVEYFSSGAVLAATHSYIYDGGTNQRGRLTQLVEPNSATAYTYDQKGRLTAESRTINGIAYITGYRYDAHGRLVRMTYPGGRTLDYTFDSVGRIQSISASKDNVKQTIVSNVAYQPFGGLRGYTFGNGQSYSRGFDGDGRISSYTVATQTIAVGYDPASRIESLGPPGIPANRNTYAYDALDRLTQFIGPSTNQSFAYDAVGNRTANTVGAATASYAYAPTSNRLATIAGLGARAYVHDPLGSVTSDGIQSFSYDARGRLVQAVNAAGSTDYQVNALGQRIRKRNAGTDTVYHYDTQGRLIAESTAAGAIQKEYVYLGDVPVAVLQ